MRSAKSTPFSYNVGDVGQNNDLPSSSGSNSATPVSALADSQRSSVNESSQSTSPPEPLKNTGRQRLIRFAENLPTSRSMRLEEKYASSPGTRKLPNPIYSQEALAEITSLAIASAKEMEEFATHLGRELTAEQQAIARSLGVEHPERILVVDSLQAPAAKKLAQVLKAAMGDSDLDGMTFRYGIFLDDKDALTHEMAHVAQYEDFGSIELFIKTYVKQVNEYGYFNSELEQDARKKVENLNAVLNGSASKMTT